MTPDLVAKPVRENRRWTRSVTLATASPPGTRIGETGRRLTGFRGARRPDDDPDSLIDGDETVELIVKVHAAGGSRPVDTTFTKTDPSAFSKRRVPPVTMKLASPVITPVAGLRMNSPA